MINRILKFLYRLNFSNYININFSGDFSVIEKKIFVEKSVKTSQQKSAASDVNSRAVRVAIEKSKKRSAAKNRNKNRFLIQEIFWIEKIKNSTTAKEDRDPQPEIRLFDFDDLRG